ncbi:hypothetical protein Tco_1139434 [Tanacetum coccineum]
MTGALRRGNPGDDIGATLSGISKNVIGATPSGISVDDVEATLIGPTPSTKEQIEGHLSARRSLVKEHNSRGNISPIHLNFDDVEDRTRVRTVVTGKEIVVVDLKKPFKEAVKTPLTRRMIEFACPEFKMPINIKLYDGTTDPKDHLSRLSFAANSGEWPMPLAKRYSDKVPKAVDEIMARLDDFVRSEEAFSSTELPKSEVSEAFKKLAGLISKREDRFHRGGYGVDRRRNNRRNTLNNRDGIASYRSQAPYQAPRAKLTSTESRKLNHLVKDVRQRGRGNTKGRDAGKYKVINMIRSWTKDRKRKSVERDKIWMKTPIVFLPVSLEDASNEPLVIEAVMEGYLVCRVYVDQGASVENEVENSSSGFFSTIYSMVKFPTSRGVATLVTQTMIISECQRLEKKQMIEREIHLNMFPDEEGQGRVDLTEHTLVNPSCPDQLVTTGGNLSEGCKNQLKALLKKMTRSSSSLSWLLPDAVSKFQTSSLNRSRRYRFMLVKSSPRLNDPKIVYDTSSEEHGCFYVGTSRHDKYNKETRRAHSQCQPVNRTCRVKKKGPGVRKEPGGDQRGRGVGKSRNSSPCEVPHMDIQPGAGKEEW